MNQIAFKRLTSRIIKQPGIIGLDLEEKLAAAIAKKIRIDATGCWRYGRVSAQNYARIMVFGRMLLVHRVAYILVHGPIPENYHIDHLCNVPGCCNPDHLNATTPKLNNARSNSRSAINTRKQTCIRGHPLSGDNVRYTKQGQRQCRQCDAVRRRSLKARRA